MDGLGFLPQETNSYARAISADGSAVTGFSSQYCCSGVLIGNGTLAMRWSSVDGMVSLGLLPGGFLSVGVATSADGSTIVGYGSASAAGGSNRAFRWAAPGGMSDLGTLPGFTTSDAAAVSADGSVVTGRSGSLAYRWTPTEGMASLGVLPDYSSSSAVGIDATGRVIAGTSFNASTSRAFRWTLAGGMSDLGTLPGDTSSTAAAISGDGLVILGRSSSPVIGRTFRWTAVDGMRPLDTAIPGTFVALNGDGSVAVGNGVPTQFIQHPLLWTEQTGTLVLDAYLRMLGVDLTGWSLSQATGVSADGRRIAGIGQHNGVAEAWIATLPAVLPLCVSVGPIQSTEVCPSGSGVFTVVATGMGTLTFQWQIEASPNNWSTLSADPVTLVSCSDGGSGSATGPIRGLATASIRVQGCPGVQHWNIRVLVSSLCGTVASNEAKLVVCPADFNCSGAVAESDIFDFLSAWFALDPRADFNGVGGITTQDIFDFLAAWFSGC